MKATLCRPRVHLILASWMAILTLRPAWPVPDWDCYELIDLHDALRAAANVTPETYPDADAVWIRSGQIARYQPDGTSEERFDAFAKVLTEKGRRDLQTFRFGFNAVYGDVEVVRLEIFRPDGSRVPIDVRRISREMIDPDQIHKNIYDPNHRILQVGVPGLEIGDVIRVSGRRRITRARMPDTWADYAVFEGEMPILEEWYEVHAPKARPLRHRVLRDEVPGTMTYEERPTDNGLAHRWTLRNVPRYFEEPNMPPAHTVVQRLLVSTIEDWPTVSRWYWELSRPRLEAVTPEMRETIRALREARPDPEALLRAIFYHVAQNIRYMGLTTETVAPGYEPRDVGATYAARYGVCRDKAAVLVAMLRLAGFDAFPVLIHVGPRLDAEVPLPYFNHAIVAVRQPDGTFRLMDPTDETVTDLFPAYLGNRSFLVATPEGEPLRVSPVPPAHENLMRIHTTARLDATGVLEAHTTLRFEGVNEDAYRGYFARIKPEERRRFFEGLVKRALPGAVLTSYELSPADLRDTHQPLQAEIRFAAPDAWIADSGLAVPLVPVLGSSVGVANFILGQTGLERRRFPLVTEHPCGVTETIDLEFTGSARPAVWPPAAKISAPRTSWRCAWSFDETVPRARWQSDFILEGVEYSPAEYLELKEALRQIAFEMRRRPVMQLDGRLAEPSPPAAATPAAESADLEVIEQVTTYEVRSDSEWTVREQVRQRVLTFAGLRAAAEVKVPFNPAWTEVRLDAARVVQSDGTVREVAPHEVNLMDQAWVAAAPRYPPGRILVVNLPGLSVGSTIEYAITRSLRDRPFFHLMETFGGHEPVARREVRLRVPNDVPVQTRLLGDGVKSSTSSTDDGHEYVWTTTDTRAIPREDGRPPLWAMAPALIVSRPDAAAHYARTVHEALDRATREATVCAAAAREIAAARPDRWARLRAIRDAVARRVRSAGPGLYELPLSAISPADVTWADGYGNSADTAVVLAAMLRAVGEEPHFVLVSSIHPVADILRAPMHDFQPQLFPTVLVRVPVDGEWIYFNDTDQYAPLGATPNEGRACLVLPEGTFDTVRARPNFESRTDTHYRIRVRSDGAAELRITRRYAGMQHAERAKFWAEATPEERRRQHQEMVAEIAQDAIADGDLETDFTQHPGMESLAVRIVRYGVKEGSWFHLTLPPLGSGVPLVRADTRATPIYRSDTQRRLTRVELELPFDLRPRLFPGPYSFSVGGGRGTTTVERKGTLLRIERQTLWEPAWIGAEGYADLLELHRRLTHPRDRFLLWDNWPDVVAETPSGPESAPAQP